MANDFVREDSATKREWERKKAERETNYEAARTGMYTALKELLTRGGEAVKEGVKEDLLAAKGNRLNRVNEDGYGHKDDYDELVDGKIPGI